MREVRLGDLVTAASGIRRNVLQSCVSALDEIDSHLIGISGLLVANYPANLRPTPANYREKKKQSSVHDVRPYFAVRLLLDKCGRMPACVGCPHARWRVWRRVAHSGNPPRPRLFHATYQTVVRLAKNSDDVGMLNLVQEANLLILKKSKLVSAISLAGKVSRAV